MKSKLLWLGPNRPKPGRDPLEKWNPMLFAQAVVVVAFDHMLTSEMVAQLGKRAVRFSGATVNVADLK
jgi:hypothetical protein